MAYILDMTCERRWDKCSEMLTTGKSVWREFGKGFGIVLLIFVKICIKKYVTNGPK